MDATITPQQIYEASVKSLSVVDRLQLVKLVLDDLMSDPGRWAVNEGDAWSAEDYADLTQASLSYAAWSLEERSP